MATFLNETTIILGAGVNKEIWEEIGVGQELIQGIADRVHAGNLMIIIKLDCRHALYANIVRHLI